MMPLRSNSTGIGFYVLALCIEDLHAVVRAVPALGTGHQLPGIRADLGMGRQRITRLERTVVVVQAHRG